MIDLQDSKVNFIKGVGVQNWTLTLPNPVHKCDVFSIFTHFVILLKKGIVIIFIIWYYNDINLLKFYQDFIEFLTYSGVQL